MGHADASKRRIAQPPHGNSLPASKKTASPTFSAGRSTSLQRACWPRPRRILVADMTNLMRRERVVLAVDRTPVFLAAALLLAGCTLPFGPGRDGGPGDAAHDLVSGSKYPKLVVEIDHPSGAAPTPEALDHLRATLRSVTGKTSVDVTLSGSIPTSSKEYTLAEIARLEDEHRDQRTSGDTAVLYVLYVAGGSEDDTSEGKVLGATYRGTSIVMFKGNIRANTNTDGNPLSGRPPESVVESAVLVHEFGHAAGLVNLGTPMVRPHEDPQHEGHSTNRESVMYWAVENTQGLLGLVQCGLDPTCGIPLEFDADDKADLQRLRER